MVGIQKPIFLISQRKGASFELASILLVLFISIVILFLFLFNSSTFNQLSKEDNIIEWGSAILLFGSFLFTGLTLLNYHRSLNNLSFVKLFIGLMSIAFFIIFMEEVSWFQRVLEVETPESFGYNIQDEMNLHNFATEFTEYTYYLGAFAFLVIFPFFRFISPTISSNDFLKMIAPRPFIGIIGSISCSYNFDMWNNIFIQISFFSSLVILSLFTIFSIKSIDRNITLFTMFLIISNQLLFLIFGENFDRLWEITEYKELFIPYGFFIYSFDLFLKGKRYIVPRQDFSPNYNS